MKKSNLITSVLTILCICLIAFIPNSVLAQQNGATFTPEQQQKLVENQEKQKAQLKAYNENRVANGLKPISTTITKKAFSTENTKAKSNTQNTNRIINLNYNDVFPNTNTTNRKTLINPATLANPQQSSSVEQKKSTQNQIATPKVENKKSLTFEERVENMTDSEINLMLQEMTTRQATVEPGSAESQKLSKIISILNNKK